MKNIICIPYSPCGGKFKNGKELRYVLRGFAKHFKGDYEVVLVGPKKPEWYKGTWLEQTHGKLKTALKLAADTYPDGFFWWYDDCVLIQDQTAEQLKITPARQSWGRIWTNWGASLEKIKVRLEKEGYTPWDYSKPHGPYWFNKGMIDEAFNDWPNMAGKFPFESWILSKRDYPRRFGVEAQYYNDFRSVPSAEKIFVNWCDRGFTPELISWLDQQFPNDNHREISNMSFEEVSQAGSEEIGNMDNDHFRNATKIIADQVVPTRILFTAHEGCDPRVWAWCGHGIKVFAKSHNATLIELPNCLDLNPQWVIFDAFNRSLSYPETNEFAWVDGDLVIAYPATNIWEIYPNSLHLCVNREDYKDRLRARMNMPDSIPNNCTGVIKWNYAEGQKLSDWYDNNKHRFPKSDGDQELLGVALHETGLNTSFFHPKMHVAGANPPKLTSFKHKGGPAKLRWIPRFINDNKRLGINPPDNFLDISSQNCTSELFTEIFKKHFYVGESRSGVGSSLQNTANIRAALPTVFEKLSIRSLVDCPCGDWNWMSMVNLDGINYTGVDIVSELVELNKSRYGREGVSFMVADITKDLLPFADMVIVRDCFGHLPDEDILKALHLLKRSGIKWLASTTFPAASNINIPVGEWKPINLSTCPYHLGEPYEYIREVESGKHIGIWKLND
jgi:2-polyprenyl-3-methyl-5-hydroxy-6-metoxy-1,4-benzoquinol methylase